MCIKCEGSDVMSNEINLISDRFKLAIGYGICEECKRCSNYFVSELGCFGNKKPCEHLCEH